MSLYGTQLTATHDALRQEVLSAINEVLNADPLPLFCAANGLLSPPPRLPHSLSFSTDEKRCAPAHLAVNGQQLSTPVQPLHQELVCHKHLAVSPFPSLYQPTSSGSNFLGHSVAQSDQEALLSLLHHQLLLPYSLPPHVISNPSDFHAPAFFEQNQSLTNSASCTGRSWNHLSPALPIPLLQNQRAQLQQENLVNTTPALDHDSNLVIRTISAIGSTNRQRTYPYIDVLSFNLPPAPTRNERQGGSSDASRGIMEQFPVKLHRMLRDSIGRQGTSNNGCNSVAEDGFSEIVSFFPHGRSFAIHDVERFVTEIMPLYFPQQTKWNSFTRQLNLWGFLKIRSGPDADALATATTSISSIAACGFYHELFLQSRPDLCCYMRRVGASNGTADGRKLRKLRNARNAWNESNDEDPNFYVMKHAT